MTVTKQTHTDPVLGHALQLLASVEDHLHEVSFDTCDEDHDTDAHTALGELRAVIALVELKATVTEHIVSRDPSL